MKFTTIVTDNKIKPNKEQQEKINEFLCKNNNERIIVEYISKSDVAFHQHKYYWGTLIPKITECMGEHNLHYVNILLKRDFLYKEIKDIDEIPKRFLKIAPYPFERDMLFNLHKYNLVPFSMITGQLLLVHHNNFIVGYIPSNADLTYEEKELYNKKCEHRLIIDLGGCLD